MRRYFRLESSLLKFMKHFDYFGITRDYLNEISESSHTVSTLEGKKKI